MPRKTTLSINSFEETLDAFIAIMEPYCKEHIYDCNTLNELVATFLLKNKKDVILYSVRVSLIDFLTQILPNENVNLSEFTTETLEELLIGKKSVRNISAVKSVFTLEILNSGINARILIPYFLEYARGKYIKNYAAAMKKKIEKPETVYEHYLCADIDNKYSNYDFFCFMRDNANVSPEDFEWKTIIKHIICKSTRSNLKKTIFSPLQKNGVLSEHFFETGLFFEWYREHIKNKKDIPKEERTVLWYVMEVYEDRLMLLKGWEKLKIISSFKEVIHIKAVDFSYENFQTVRSNKSGAYKEVIEMMIHDEMCSHDVLEEKEEVYEINWNDDVWYYSERAKYDFIKIPKTFRESAKIYTKEYTEKLTKRSVRMSDLLIMFEGLLSTGVTCISELTQDKKKSFYVLLRSMDKQGGKEKKAAIRILKQFRSFISTLQKFKYSELNGSLRVKNDNFRIKKTSTEITVYSDDDMLKILEFIKSDESVTRDLMGRIEVCAFGLIALLGRRVGEMINSKRKGKGIGGLKIDALKTWGMSGEYGLSYYSPKHKAWEFVLLSDLVGYRTDPFAKELIELVPLLLDEAVNITSKFRKSLPEKLKDILFVTPSPDVGYAAISSATMLKKMYRVFEAIGIDRKGKNFHTYRHLIATNIILSGGTVADAADALKDLPKTVAKYYHQYTTRVDTLKHFAAKGRVQMVDAMKDSEHLDKLNNKQHKVLMPDHLSEDGYKVVGGNCVSEAEHRQNCSTFQMTNSPDGCVGCRYLEVNAIENKDYWLALMNVRAESMSSLQVGSISYRWEKAGYQRAKIVVEDIEQKELENEFG